WDYAHGIVIDNSTGIIDNNTIISTSSNKYSSLVMMNGGSANEFIVRNNFFNPTSSYVIWGHAGTFLPGSDGNMIVGIDSYAGTQCMDTSSATGTVGFTNADDCTF